MRLALKSEIELPREVDRIANTRSETLTSKGRHFVCSITHDENTSRTPLLRPSRLKAVDGVAFHRGVVGSYIER